MEEQFGVNNSASNVTRAPRLVVVFALMVALGTGLLAASSAGASRPSVPASASAQCVLKKQNKFGDLVAVTRTKKVRGKRVKVRVKVNCAKAKLCVVRTKKKGKSVTVYLTRVVTRKVKGKKKRQRVFVYKTKVVKKKVKGKTVKRRVFVKRHGKKIKVKKLGACAAKTPTNSGVPVTVTLTDPSTADLDFGGFKRRVELTGTLKGFIVGKGFQLGQENQIQFTGGKINLAPTGIFIDDLCDGQVSDAIRTDPASFAQIDPTTNAQHNAVTVAPNSTITGLIHLRIQTALDLRNKETGCNQPYLTTGWTDISVPLFLKGKLGASGGGLTSTITVGQTVLDQLAACLALGKPTQPCNGFAIPFPAIFTSKITGIVKIGS